MPAVDKPTATYSSKEEPFSAARYDTALCSATVIPRQLRRSSKSAPRCSKILVQSARSSYLHLSRMLFRTSWPFLVVAVSHHAIYYQISQEVFCGRFQFIPGIGRLPEFASLLRSCPPPTPPPGVWVHFQILPAHVGVSLRLHS